MSDTTAPATALSIKRVPYSPVALGLVANFVSLWPPFDNYEFGIMMASLRYQLEWQTHLVGDVDDTLVAYLGWIETTRSIAEAWLSNDGPLHPAVNADAVAVTILATASPDYVLPLIKAAKAARRGVPVYWKRYYLNGRPTKKHAVVKKAP